MDNSRKASDKAVLIGALLTFVITLVAYSATLAPTVTFVDSGELIVAAKYLGVAHPPGTPLYVLLAPVHAFAIRERGRATELCFRVICRSGSLSDGAVGQRDIG